MLKQVNRLTRQLSLLRAQQVSSPTSHPISDDLLNTYPPPQTLSHLPGRSRRASSNASTALTNAATAGGSTALSLSRQSSIRSLSGARAGGESNSAIAPPLSRQSSVRSVGGGNNSGRNSPVVGGSSYESPYPYYTSQFYHSQPTSGGVLLNPNYTGGSSSWKDRESQYTGSDAGGSEKGLGLSYGSVGSTSGRYDEVLAARTELESVRRENEKLKDRIRELERGLEESTRVRTDGRAP